MRFSIIIPMYNAEDTLDKCLSSIEKQRFQDYEVLIVDDGSTDSSSAVASTYTVRDSRFIVVSSVQKGAGAARNLGLKHASGEYVLYMDADDYWLPDNLLQELDHHIIAYPANVYMYQMVKLTEDGRVLARYTKPPFRNPDKALKLEDVYSDLVRDGQTLAAAWNKCVSRNLLVQNTLCEDIDWVLRLFSCVRTICLINMQAYAYTQHKTPSRSTRSDAPNSLASILYHWGQRISEGNLVHTEAVAGVVAFEFGICMGSHHLLSPENKRMLRQNTHLLNAGLDRKTTLIRRFYRVFGYRLTCAAIRLYLMMRRIW